jgi:hypothetical protein
MAEFRVVLDVIQNRSETSFVWIWRDGFEGPKECPYDAVGAMFVSQ